MAPAVSVREKHEAEIMAEFVERWLGNPAMRGTLRFLTKRCPQDGWRAERALEAYANGHARGLCFECKVGSYIMNRFLEMIIAKMKIPKSEAMLQLKDSMWRKGFASVLKGLAEYGPVKPFISYAPFLVVWNITKTCNLRCRHCYEVADKPAPDELTTEEALDAVDKMADAGIAYIAISGGEPLMRHDIFRIAERIKQRGMGFSVATNGTLLTPEKVKKLKELDCLFIQISLDGATPESHNWFRGRDSFERTIEGIRNAVNNGMITGVSTTVTQHNYKEIPEIIYLAENLGVDIFVPTGRGKDIVNLDLSPEQREDLLRMMATQNKHLKIKLLSTAPQYGRVCAETEAATLAMTHFDYFSSESDGSLRFLADFIGGCGAARLYCGMEPNGDIKPCVFIPIKLGNIKKDDFLHIWHNSLPLIKMRERDQFKGNCGMCEHRNICGGCRARAYGYFNDVQAPDPGCINNSRLFQKIKIPVKQKLHNVRRKA